jgi:hypothetical protein
VFRSPKTILAEQLTALLSVYFDVDNGASIESNLRHDTKILLRHLGLQTIVITKPSGLVTNTVTGRVWHVEFIWKWDGDGTTSFIRKPFCPFRGWTCTWSLLITMMKASSRRR